MRSEIATAESFTNCWHPAEFVVSPELPIRIAEPTRRGCCSVQSFASRLATFCDYHVMIRLPRFLMPLLAGFGVTLLQLVMAIGLLAPEEPFTERYSALIQHDSYWFMNIIDRG